MWRELDTRNSLDKKWEQQLWGASEMKGIEEDVEAL